MSVGGWTYSLAFHDKFLIEQSRQQLASSCASLLKQYDDIFDGIDLDLEYPCLPNDNACGPNIKPSPNDRDAFTSLIR